MNPRVLMIGGRLSSFLLGTAVAAITIAGIRLIPIQRCFRILNRACTVARNRAGRLDRYALIRVSDDLWAAGAVGRRMPGATCLVNAMVAKYLLARRGLDAALEIGVAPSRPVPSFAHAWLELDGQVVLGGETSPEVFTPFPQLPAFANGRFDRR